MLDQDTKDTDLLDLKKIIRFKLLKNSIYFKTVKKCMFNNTDFEIQPGATLLRSGVKLSRANDHFTFNVLYEDKIENPSTDEEDFGLVDT